MNAIFVLGLFYDAPDDLRHWPCFEMAVPSSVTRMEFQTTEQRCIISRDQSQPRPILLLSSVERYKKAIDVAAAADGLAKAPIKTAAQWIRM